mmetsp:Transcript_5089/g.12785  ORF Transcript_5089/g.12785 Transcript_5089/m.12785 type:complete len:232 (-) Transcript_5089:1555-2250(-)
MLGAKVKGAAARAVWKLAGPQGACGREQQQRRGAGLRMSAAPEREREKTQAELKGQTPFRGIWVEGPSFSSTPLLEANQAARHQRGPSKVKFTGIHHAAIIVDSLERSLEFYQGVLGMQASHNPERPDQNLPFRGAFLEIGHESVHLMELNNPDPLDPALRPAHGGRDRHFCVGVESVDAVIAELEAVGWPYTASKSGRKAVFFRDPDMNVLECLEMGQSGGIPIWRQPLQ